ncbi:MAG: ice-binding family protein [Paludibacter sp.]|nr:ice-binding family protein [Paludibacter sp.]
MKLKIVLPIFATVLVGLISSCSNELDAGKNPNGTLSEPINSTALTTVATPAVSPMVVDLKTAARFGILSGVAITSTGYSTINNFDVGIYPGVRSQVVGFPPAVILNGAVYASDDVANPGTLAYLIQAKQDLTDAYTFAESAISPTPVIIAGDQGGRILTAGIYKSTSTVLIESGNLTLDAQGDSTAVWIFQVGSALTTVAGTGGNVILTGGAQAKNVFWQVTSSATLGANTTFNGNILALTSITLNSGATITGRVLARNAAVTLTSTNILTKP